MIEEGFNFKRICNKKPAKLERARWRDDHLKKDYCKNSNKDKDKGRQTIKDCFYLACGSTTVTEPATALRTFDKRVRQMCVRNQGLNENVHKSPVLNKTKRKIAKMKPYYVHTSYLIPFYYEQKIRNLKPKLAKEIMKQNIKIY